MFQIRAHTPLLLCPRSHRYLHGVNQLIISSGAVRSPLIPVSATTLEVAQARSLRKHSYANTLRPCFATLRINCQMHRYVYHRKSQLSCFRPFVAPPSLFYSGRKTQRAKDDRDFARARASTRCDLTRISKGGNRFLNPAAYWLWFAPLPVQIEDHA